MLYVGEAYEIIIGNGAGSWRIPELEELRRYWFKKRDILNFAGESQMGCDDTVSKKS